MALFDYMALGVIYWLRKVGKEERRRMETEAGQDAWDELEEEEEEKEEEEELDELFDDDVDDDD